MMITLGQLTKEVAFSSNNGFENYRESFVNPQLSNKLLPGDIYWKEIVNECDAYIQHSFLFVQIVSVVEERVFYKEIDYVFEDADLPGEESESYTAYWFPLRSVFLNTKIEELSLDHFYCGYKVFYQNNSKVISYSIDKDYWNRRIRGDH